MRFLLDTNIVSFLVKGPSSRLASSIAAVHPAQTVTSVIVEAELLAGLERRPASRFARDVFRVLDQLTILPWTSTTARTYAHLRTRTESLGRSIGALDLLIAAHALAEDCVLVTNDARLLSLSDLLSVTDWT